MGRAVVPFRPLWQDEELDSFFRAAKAPVVSRALFANPANRPCGQCARPLFSARPGAERAPQAEHVGHAVLRRSARYRLLLVAAALAFPLGVACWLVPDPRGEGTHEQLGLPGCGFRTQFGVRCPTCGMTTAWAFMVRLEIGSAVRANVAGALLAMLDAASVAWLVVCGARGRWWPAPPNPTALAWLLAALAAVALGEWVVRLEGHVACWFGNL